MSIKIDCVSDLHGFFPKLEGGDLLIVAGDLTARDTPEEYDRFCNWMQKLPYRKKVVIGGNHDTLLQHADETGYTRWAGWGSYFCDSGTEFEGLKIWSSPWSKTFDGMNPHCKAFTKDTEEELAEKWAFIPEDVDILVTHSPPFSILDATVDRRQVGSSSLMARHLNGMHPRLWVWGHIHESYGKVEPYDWAKTIYVNASHVNERYEPVNNPIRVIL
jgi:Icc-related predicted phosphoesterase